MILLKSVTTKLSICQELTGNFPLMGIYYPFNNLTITGNDFIDHRNKTRFFSSNYSIRNKDKNMNFFNEAKCSHI